MPAATHGLHAALHWEVDRSPAPRVHIRPGGYTDDPERASLLVGSRTVQVYVSGPPADLRAWAQRVEALADELADSNGSEVAGDA
jgi:hypothetical protein